jgi:excinuclease UvrABC nuclease subunit
MLEGFKDVSVMLKPGIYALIKDGVVVYIGQAKRPLTRIEAHRSLWGRKSAPGWLPIKAILFDEVHVLPCRVEDLDVLERALIELYKPKYNVKLKSPAPVDLAAWVCPPPARPSAPPIVRRF